MNIIDRDIDGGKPFDWGKISNDYAEIPGHISSGNFMIKIVSPQFVRKRSECTRLGYGNGSYTQKYV